VLSLLDREGSIKASSSRCSTCAPRGSPGSRRCRASAARRPGDRPPNVWFSQAHRAGLGPRLEAAALSMALSAPGRPTAAFLSLNVSPSTLTSDEVRAALPDDLSSVVIEITENELVTAAPSLHGILEELRGRGARIAVDDAGAGYAGFTQLLRLRPDIIKLDRELVPRRGRRRLPRRARRLVRALRRSIDALICAEGIETLADLRALADLDVTYGQGYVLAPPGRPWPEVDESAVAACYSAWQAALRGRAGSSMSEESALERVAAKVSAVHGADDIPAALDEACRHLGAERGCLRRALADGTLVTVGGMPLTAGRAHRRPPPRVRHRRRAPARPAHRERRDRPRRPRGPRARGPPLAPQRDPPRPRDRPALRDRPHRSARAAPRRGLTDLAARRQGKPWGALPLAPEDRCGSIAA
jgi:EAL domain-containing protein (putative c-di-GMP-specific phosphodiesterase class I)